PLEMAHIKINGKALDNIEELTPDQLQWKYLMTEGAKTIDELFDAMPGSIPQRGDNIGDEIGSMLRPNKVENTPLDNIPNKTDDYVDDFEAFNEKLNVEDSKNILEQIQNKSDKPKERAKINPITEQKLAEYESKLNLPEPQSFFDDIELPPGVDEDGVIQDLTKTFDSKSPDKTPSFEEFKETVSKNS